MANNETTTKFRVDISELKKAMQEAKRSVAVANSEFKAVSSTMDDWTKSSDGLKAKLKQLDDNLKAQDKILESLEEQYKLTVKEMGEGSKAADDLKIKINNQKAVINNTKRQIDQYNQTLAEVSDAEKEAAKSGKSVTEVLDDMGKAAEDTGEGFTTFKGAIATFAGNMITGFVSAIGEGISAIVGLADETREYRTELGKLETAFSTAGFSGETATDTYKELFSIIGETDQAVEASQQIALLASAEEDLAKWAGYAGGVVGRFGDALQPEAFYESANETLRLNEATGTYVQMLEGVGYSVDEFNAGLQACTTEEEKQAYMLQVTDSILGEASKTYKEVNADIIDAQKAQADLTDATANLGAVAEPIMTTFKSMGATFLNELLPSVQELGGGFTDLLNGVEGAEQRIGTSLGGLVDTVLGKVTELLPKVLSVGLSLVTSLITGILNALPKLVTTVFNMAGTVLEALSTALPQIALAIVEVVPKIIDALMTMLPTFITACIDFLSAIVEALPSVVQAILKAIPQLITSIVSGLLSGVTALFNGAVQLFMALAQALPEIVNILIEELPVIIDVIITTLLGALPQLLQACITLYMALIDVMPQIITALLEALPTLIVAIMDSLYNAMPLLLETALTVFMMLVQAIPTIQLEVLKAMGLVVMAVLKALLDLGVKIAQLYVKMYSTLGKWALEIIKKGADTASKFVTTVIDWLKDIVPKVWNWLVNVVTKVIEWRANMINKARETALDFINSVISYVSQLPSKVWTWLVNVITKLIEWRANMINKAKEAGKGFVDNVINAIKGLPDRMREIGASIVEGIFSGISNGWSWLTDSVSNLAGSLFESAKSALGINSPSKVFADEVGKWIPEGIAVGIDKNAKSVLQSVKDVTMGAVSSARAGLATADTVSTGGTAVTGGVVNNFYQTNNSPKALSRLEIYRQSKNLLGLAGGV